MQTIKVGKLPDCDMCGVGNQKKMYDAPTTRDSHGRGRWAHLCGNCFALYGIETSVTTKMVLRDG